VRLRRSDAGSAVHNSRMTVWGNRRPRQKGNKKSWKIKVRYTKKMEPQKRRKHKRGKEATVWGKRNDRKSIHGGDGGGACDANLGKLVYLKARQE